MYGEQYVLNIIKKKCSAVKYIYVLWATIHLTLILYVF